MPLRVHDTRRRDKVDFTTMNPGVVNMYVCGVTVYDLCHLGHARCYLAFDLIHRWLEKSGYDVNYVQKGFAYRSGEDGNVNVDTYNTTR